MPIRCIGGGLALAVVLFAGAAGAPPDVKAVFPTGGQRGESVALAVTGNVGSPPAAVWCSRPELKVEPAAEAGRYTASIPADAAPGVVWLRWHNSEGASPLRAFVIGTLPELVEKEPNNELSAATSVDPPRAVVSGVLDKAGEVDTFAVPLKMGETLVASLDGNGTFGSPMDAALQIVSPRGFVVLQNHDDRGLDPQAAYTAESDGTHYVRIFAFPSEPNSSIALAGGPSYLYRLTLTTGPFADHAMPLAVTRGGTAAVRLLGWNIPADWPQLPVAINDDSDVGAVHHPELANPLAVRVVRHPSLIEAETQASGDVRRIAPPVTVSGRLEARREIDAYAFTAKKGERLAVRSEARALGSPLDPALRIVDATGRVLQENDDPQRGEEDAALTWSVPADGEYRVEIRDLYGDGGPRYFYRLTVAAEEPGVSLTVPADLFTLSADKPLEIPVTITRTAGFAGELEVSVAGLPPGVSVAPAKSLPKDDSAKLVKLWVQRGEGTMSGGAPIRIVAVSAGEQPVTRHADAPIAGLRQRTRDLWLMVPPAK